MGVRDRLREEDLFVLNLDGEVLEAPANPALIDAAAKPPPSDDRK